MMQKKLEAKKSEEEWRRVEQEILKNYAMKHNKEDDRYKFGRSSYKEGDEEENGRKQNDKVKRRLIRRKRRRFMRRNSNKGQKYKDIKWYKENDEEKKTESPKMKENNTHIVLRRSKGIFWKRR